MFNIYSMIFWCIFNTNLIRIIFYEFRCHFDDFCFHIIFAIFECIFSYFCVIIVKIKREKRKAVIVEHRRKLQPSSSSIKKRERLWKGAWKEDLEFDKRKIEFESILIQRYWRRLRWEKERFKRQLCGRREREENYEKMPKLSGIFFFKKL